MNRVNFTAEYCFLKPLLGKKLQYLTNQHVCVSRFLLQESLKHYTVLHLLLRNQ